MPKIKTNPSGVAIPSSFKKVLVLQGGGALGAYQLGVYKAIHEKNIALDWVIGTSIGAINGGIIAGNPPESRLQKLLEFWKIVQNQSMQTFENNKSLFNLYTMTYGVKGFFSPTFLNWFDVNKKVDIENASYYSTTALKDTLSKLIDFDYLNSKKVRLSVGAVSAITGEMRYFDSAKEELTLEHIMASSALPPAFPAVKIDGEPFWDGGIYSNTPIEAVLEDYPRDNSLIFSVQLWNPLSKEPSSIQEVLTKQKDIQFASRDRLLENVKKTHRLRHILRRLTDHIPESQKKIPEVQELMSWGCDTVMHIIYLTIDRIEGEDQMKDIDFTSEGISKRSLIGFQEATRAINSEIWNEPHDPNEGILIHAQFR